jgi:hypothetical protein
MSQCFSSTDGRKASSEGENERRQSVLQRMKYLSASAVFLILLVCPPARADSWTFGLLPGDGNISGVAGSTIGWGYTITNQSATDWLVLTNINSDVFQNGTPFSVFDFPELAPGATATLAFDPVLLTGLFALTWDTTAPVGFVTSGSFDVSAEFWDGDPNAGGNFVANADDQSATYSATVTSSAVGVPEPCTALLALAGIGMLGLKRRS